MTGEGSLSQETDTGIQHNGICCRLSVLTTLTDDISFERGSFMQNSLRVADDSKSILECNTPRLIQILEKRESEFLHNIYEVARKTETVLSNISDIFPNYTLHDINHSIRIMEYMFDLINDVNELSDLELAILIYSAILHDIGMYASENEIERIKNFKDLVNFDISYAAILRKYDGNEKIAVQYYIRSIHGQRSAEFIKDRIKNYLVVPSQNISFAEDVALCCLAHTMDETWLAQRIKTYNQKSKYNYNLQYLSVLLRLADILDIDSSRTPLFLYDLINPQGESTDEWKQHFVIYNKEKVKYEKNQNQRKIVMMGECDDPKIHRKILKYLEWINYEIKTANILTDKMDDIYKLNLKYPLENLIEPKGYKISDLQLTIDFIAITNLLMGERIYGEKKLGLRELIQNSIDACNVRKEIENKTKEVWENSYSSLIQIILDKASNNVIIKDNGTGMSLEIIKNYFLNIGLSYYRSDRFLLKDLKYNLSSLSRQRFSVY